MMRRLPTGPNCRHIHAARVLCACAIVAWSAPAVAAELTCPLPEDYLPSGRTADYLKEATTYLSRNASSKFAPRVALDLLMVAENAKSETVSNTMKALLLFEYGESLQGAYILTSFEDAGTFREFLLAQADRRLKSDPGQLPRHFTRAVANGLRHFEAKLLEGGPFLLKAYCLADAAGSEQVASVVLQALRREASDDDALAALMEVCIDTQTPTPEKVLRLHGLDGDAAFLKRFYLSTLSPTEGVQPGILRIRVENAINSRDYEEAKLLISSLPQEDREKPEVLFWKGWVLFALREEQHALDALDELVREHPTSEWAATAKTYGEGIRYMARGREENVKAILAISKALQEGVGILEAHGQYEHDPGKAEPQTYAIYVGIVPKENRLVVMLHRNGVLSLGYRSTDRRSAIYLKEGNTTLAFGSPGPIPAPSLSLTRGDDGAFSIQTGLAMESSIERAGAKASSLFDSPFLSTREGIQTLLEYTSRRYGWVPGKPVTVDGTSAFVWHVPSTTSSVMKKFEYRTSEDNRFSYMKYAGVCLESLKYGETSSFKLSPPPWPDSPVEESEKFDINAMMKLMGAAMELVQSKGK